MVNRLARSASPYLLQHATNPVDWYEWGPEAFAEARRRDVPVLVSIGYAACHWCHVMAHESFEDPGTAAVMNAGFVSVKVDREERPDVDAAYMAATQATTGQGGWPMTVFATPDGEPFYCGTYYPPVAVGGHPAFRDVLDAVSRAWRERNADVRASAALLADALSGSAAEDAAGGPDGGADGDAADGPDGGADQGPDDRAGSARTDGGTRAPGAQAVAGPASAGQPALSPRRLDAVSRRALTVLAGAFDTRNGGFGGAPKFPPSTVLEWLLRVHARTGDRGALSMAAATLEAMARGGMADQLGGGFARYAVDATWTVPHVEKMLEDNAVLLRVYAHWWRATGSPLARRVVEGTAGWLLTALRTPEGGFAASLDADTDGVEGATYRWTPDQLVEVLGPQDGAWAVELFGLDDPRGEGVLQLRREPAPHDVVRYTRVRRALLAARGLRPQPARDDKVVAAWNGLAVAALAEAGAMLDRREWVAAAARAAELVLTVHGGTDATGAVRLVRTSRDGSPGPAPGTLADHAAMAEGVLVLAAVTGDERWFRRGSDLLDTVLARFGDGHGGFWDTADDTTDPVVARLRRPHDVADGPSPAGQACAASALLVRAALTGSAADRLACERALVEPLTIAERIPRAVGASLAVAEALLDGPRAVAVVGRPDDPGRPALVRAVLRASAPGLALAQSDPDDVARTGTSIGLLEDRPLVGGRAAAYVCRGFVCDLPVTDPGLLRKALRTAAPPTPRPHPHPLTPEVEPSAPR